MIWTAAAGWRSGSRPGWPAAWPGARPACPVRAPSGAVRGASGGVRARVRSLPASRLPAAFCRAPSGSLAAGPAWPSGASARVPRLARFRAPSPGRSPPRLRWPRPVGAVARPSLGASFPPAAAPRRPCWALAWAAGAVPAPPRLPAPCPLPARPSCGRPCSAPGAAWSVARLAAGGSPPPGPPLRGGFALAPPAGGPRAALRAASWPLRGPPAKKRREQKTGRETNLRLPFRPRFEQNDHIFCSIAFVISMPSPHGSGNEADEGTK